MCTCVVTDRSSFTDKLPDDKSSSTESRVSYDELRRLNRTEFEKKVNSPQQQTTVYQTPPVARFETERSVSSDYSDKHISSRTKETEPIRKRRKL